MKRDIYAEAMEKLGKLMNYVHHTSLCGTVSHLCICDANLAAIEVQSIISELVFASHKQSPPKRQQQQPRPRKSKQAAKAESR